MEDTEQASRAGPHRSSTSGLSKDSASRHNRIRFSREEGDLLPSFDSPNKLPYAKFRSMRHHSPLTPPKSLDDVRQRGHSMDTGNPSSSTSRVKRTSTAHRNGFSPLDRAPSLDSSHLAVNSFSDEYDLSHEDPQILQDVHRAVKLKARRDARMKESPRTLHPAKAPSGSSWSSSSTRPFPVSPSSYGSPFAGVTHPSEIDFSPSTGNAHVNVEPHPIPTSVDNGSTLDWGGSNQGEDRTERRWTLSMSKRKGKEKEPPISVNALEAQESQYTVKLSRIKTVASPQTKRKRDITANQLERQYRLIYNSIAPDSPPGHYHILEVARWWGNVNVMTRTIIEQSEPFTWLRHLDTRKMPVQQLHMPWHLTALIMEEYLAAAAAANRMSTQVPPLPPTIPAPNFSISTIPENSAMFSPYSSSPDQSDTALPHSSRASSHYSLGPSLTRIKSTDGRVSFEPLVEPVRDSLEVASRSGDSALSSQYGHASSIGAVAPSSSPFHLRPRTYNNLSLNDSDDGSSAHNSLSGQSDDNMKRTVIRSPKFDQPLRDTLNLKELGLSSSSSPKPENTNTMSLDGASSMLQKIRTPPVHSRRSSTTNITRVGPKARGSLALSPPEDSDTDGNKKRQQDINDARSAQEYKMKSQLLEESVAQNLRIRQLLNRVATGVKEYDVTQSNLMTLLGTPYKGLPPELLDTFGHDPSAVTTKTGRYRGWRAVDDIHNRVLRQREIFEDFLAHNRNDTGSIVEEDVLEDPICVLRQSLNTLAVNKAAVASKAEELAELLKTVQETHQKVKADYKDTVAHTSVVYPELSRIVALEESYKDQYQHFWEIGMDALTFLLDTVTPFWRTYGKTIGDDFSDFLIVPLYRNEFTGESKRYPLTHVPVRSFRHWIVLIVFFYGSIAVTILQARTAFTSSVHWGLQWIPYDGLRWIAIPFFGVGIIIQWIVIMVARVVCKFF
ncbi:uncharacterized protein BT62DRAFT_299890 [Guyanagaster necrorhizus]|uniref:Uncharacterized protein n=1 Tax=Guyanagaster necrorhizus TaxID=856835 RepID=A0A9P8AY75_9AGAR|nr:uncharacterized protein BT62DRAFT_299890 [Guyanagaster necrorhizus MCA 3950]KAG7452358.1 hypothetical protein BT62DRAFT_299890 [Guyanagaster necrorhizus MCA 3950]